MTGPGGEPCETAPADGGRLIVIVGPSGSGKDTLIGWLRQRLGDRPDILFVRRTVTRLADAESEDHDTMSPAEFRQAEQDGRFAVTWGAHGMDYALPLSALDHVRRGRIAIANGSRKAVGDIERAFGDILLIRLAVDPGVLRERLRGRGRETRAEIDQRIERSATIGDSGCGGHVVDNSGPIEDAGQTVLQLIGITD